MINVNSNNGLSYYFEDYTPIKKLLEREIPKAQDYIRPDGILVKGETIDMLNKSMPLLAKMRYERTKDVPIYEGSLRDQYLKGEFSYKQQELELYQWVRDNGVFYTSIEDFKNETLDTELERILRSSFSISEFKEKYLELKEKNEAIFNQKQQEANLQAQTNTEENNPKDTFTPIQAESKNKETYTSRDDINKSFFLSFIENEREKGNDVLEFLEKLFSKIDKNKVDIRA